MEPAYLPPKVIEVLKEIIGERIGGEPTTEIEHFYRGKTCQQYVDSRRLGEVFHHEVQGHKPLPVH